MTASLLYWTYVLLLKHSWLSLSLAAVYNPTLTDDCDNTDKVKINRMDAAAGVKTVKANCTGRTITVEGVSIAVCMEDKKQFLLFESYDENDLYPTFTYHGFNEPSEWHTINISLFNSKAISSCRSLHNKYRDNTTTTKSPAAAAPTSSGPKNTGGPPASSAKAPAVPLEYYGYVPSFMRFNGHLAENFCDGPLPSPIEIDTSQAKVKDSLTDFEYSRMDTEFAIQMYFPEDGTNLLTVRALNAWGMERAPCISKGSVTGPDLCLDRFIIRYGIDGKTGSEHRLGNKTYGMEFQFFFTQQHERDRTASEFFYVLLNDYSKQRLGGSKNGTHGGSVGNSVRALAVFVEVVDSEVSDKYMHMLAEMAKLFWTSTNDNKSRSVSTLDPVFQFKSFFPESAYYTYKGSLTFPPCFPDLDWTVFEKPIKISRKDFESFLFIPSEFDETGFVAGNFRPIESIYVQLEDPFKNKDAQSRLQTQQKRLNRPIFKSLPPHDLAKDSVYDYYEDLTDAAYPMGSRPSMLFISVIYLACSIIHYYCCFKMFPFIYAL